MGAPLGGDGLLTQTLAFPLPALMGVCEQDIGYLSRVSIYPSTGRCLCPHQHCVPLVALNPAHVTLVSGSHLIMLHGEAMLLSSACIHSLEAAVYDVLCGD